MDWKTKRRNDQRKLLIYIKERKKSEKIVALALTLAMLCCMFLLPGCGKQSKSLVVYCPQSRTEFGDYLAAQAKEQLGIDIEFLKADGGTCRDKILEEKKNPQADVVMGLSQIMM